MSVGAAEALGLRELLTDIGLPTTARLRCDSTAPWELQHVKVLDA